MPPPTVKDPSLGRIVGTLVQLDDGDVFSFLGIPYAEPPERFQEPTPKTSLPNPFEATRLPPACYQTPGKAPCGLAPAVANMSEDCLYLNIWSPINPDNVTKQLPVMVWIHGGFFHSGWSGAPLYDGAVLANKGNVVVVSLNYRLGPLGFLAAAGTSVTGNAGLLDQQMALRWVRDHIAAFGGNASSVTLFGQNAGAYSISIHLMANSSAGLFQKAIMESSVATDSFVFYSKDQLNTNFMALANALGCQVSGRNNGPQDIIDKCIREKSAEEVTDAQWKIGVADGPSAFLPHFGPTVDGTFLTSSPADILAAGNFQNKSILIGTNANEGGCFLTGAFPLLFNATIKQLRLKDENYSQVMVDTFSLNPSQLVAIDFEYSTPCVFEDRVLDQSVDLAHYDALDNLFGDTVYRCPVLNYALAFANKSQQSKQPAFDVHIYEFVATNPSKKWPSWAGSALQGDELSYVFGTPFDSEYYTFSDDDRTLSDKIITYWTNFAKTGNPNSNNDGSPAPEDDWPTYGTSDQQVLILDKTEYLDTKHGLRYRECQFLQKVVPLLGQPPRTAAGDQAAAVSRWTLAVTLIVATLSATL